MAENTSLEAQSENPDDLYEVLWVCASTFMRGEVVTREQCGGNFERWLELGAIGPVRRAQPDALEDAEDDLLNSGSGNSVEDDSGDTEDELGGSDDEPDDADDIENDEEGLDGDQAPGAQGGELLGPQQEGTRKQRRKRKAAGSTTG